MSSVHLPCRVSRFLFVLGLVSYHDSCLECSLVSSGDSPVVFSGLIFVLCLVSYHDSCLECSLVSSVDLRVVFLAFYSF